VVPTYEIGLCEIEVLGDGPLLVHAFSEKAQREIEEKQKTGVTKPREKRDPEADFYAAMYVISGDPRKDPKDADSKKCKAIHGIPASGFKRGMVRASKNAGAKMDDTMCGFFIVGHHGSQYIKLDFERVEMHTAPVRLESGVCDIRYRPEYHNWKATLRIEYDAKSMPLAQIINILRRAGRFIGWGEDRPEFRLRRAARSRRPGADFRHHRHGALAGHHRGGRGHRAGRPV
jgi:hypothetical protein